MSKKCSNFLSPTHVTCICKGGVFNVHMRRLQIELHPDFVYTSYSGHQLCRSTQVSAGVFTE